MQATTLTHAEIEKLVIAAVAERAEIALDDPHFEFRASLIARENGEITGAVTIRQIALVPDPHAE